LGEVTEVTGKQGNAAAAAISHRAHCILFISAPTLKRQVFIPNRAFWLGSFIEEDTILRVAKFNNGIPIFLKENFTKLLVIKLLCKFGI